MCANYRGITLLSLPGKVYSKVLERRVWLIVESWIEEEQCGFRPGHGTTDQLFTLAGVLEGAWEYPVHMCFVDLKKAYDWVSREVLWEELREYGVRAPFLGPSNLYILKARATFVSSDSVSSSELGFDSGTLLGVYYQGENNTEILPDMCPLRYSSDPVLQYHRYVRVSSTCN